MPKLSLNAMPFEEAIEHFKSLGLASAFDYKQAAFAARQRAFAVAGVTQLDILEDIKEAVAEAIEYGLAFEDFQARMTDILADRGWTGPRPIKDPITGKTRDVDLNESWRLKAVYQTNLNSAFNVGRDEQIDEVAKARLDLTGKRTFQRLVGIDDAHTCDVCDFYLKLNDGQGLTAPHDHPIWQQLTPPLHYCDRCTFESFGEDEAADLGYKIDLPIPKIKREGYVSKRSGQVWEGPRGVQPGFGRKNYDQELSKALDQTLKRATAGNSKAITARKIAKMSLSLNGGEGSGIQGHTTPKPITYEPTFRARAIVTKDGKVITAKQPGVFGESHQELADAALGGPKKERYVDENGEINPSSSSGDWEGGFIGWDDKFYTRRDFETITQRLADFGKVPKKDDRLKFDQLGFKHGIPIVDRKLDRAAKHSQEVPRQSARCLIVEDSKIWLFVRSDEPWVMLPGGGVDSGESLLDAAMRETKEEAGFDIEIISQVIGSFDNNYGSRSYFVAKRTGGEPAKIDLEDSIPVTVRLVSLEGALRVLTSEFDRDAVKALLAGQTQELALHGGEGSGILGHTTRRYPKVKESVDGLEVGSGPIKNTDSISAELGNDYEVQKDIREIPMSAFSGIDPPRYGYYATDDIKAAKTLAERIKQSGRIDPLIVVQDKDGLYVLEGGHRLAALAMLGKKALPALLVHDTSEKTGVRSEQGAVKKNIVEFAYALLQDKGGATVNLAGDVPKKGYAVALRKDTEKSIDEPKFSDTDIDSYVDDRFDDLQKDGSYLGLWTDGGKVYMDISRIAETEKEAVEIAKANNQLAIFDIEHGETRHTERYQKQEDGSYKYGGENQRADQVRTQSGGAQAWHTQERRTERDRIAFNAGLFDESRHPRGEGGRWASTGIDTPHSAPVSSTHPSDLESNWASSHPSGNKDVYKVASGYLKSAAIRELRSVPQVKLTPEIGVPLAQAYETAQPTPHELDTQKAYAALRGEIRRQYGALVRAGYKFEPWEKPGQPYKNSQEMRDDVAKNRHLYYFKTTKGNPAHVLLPGVDNDRFRCVHDIFGHAMGGNQFGPSGETNAFLDHTQMLSDNAGRALATETMGQNSWFNFSKHNQDKATTDRDFAEQKAFLLDPKLLAPIFNAAKMQRVAEHALGNTAPDLYELCPLHCIRRTKIALHGGEGSGIFGHTTEKPESFKFDAENPPSGMSHDEAGALGEYMATSYLPLNDALRNGRQMTAAQQGKVALIKSALDKCPKVSATQYRGIVWDGKLSDFKVGSLLSEHAFSSTSLNRGTARDFALLGSSGDLSGAVLLQYFWHSSPYLGGSEEEALHPPGGEFKITTVKTEGRVTVVSLVPKDFKP